jgi:dTDP-4-dehydrorhamnose 3,5-epimerase
VKTVQLAFAGCYLFEGLSLKDDRGSFERIVDFELFDDLGLDPRITEVSTAHNSRSGTVRGLHYQVAPHEEAKTLWCASGSIFDVLVDLRETQETFGNWLSVDLSAECPTALHVPAGIAHGYQTTSPDTTVAYLINGAYAPASARTINPRDPNLGIPWPLAVTAISPRDEGAPPWPGSH